MNEKVKAYLQKQKSPQKEILERLRKIILKTFPKIQEDFKLGVPWYGDRYYIVGLKDHVNLGFAVKYLSKEEMDLLEGKGKLMRHLKFFSVDEIDEQELVKLLKMVKKGCGSCHE